MSAESPLPITKQRVAFVVDGFPTLSQTFIALQIAALKNRNIDVTVANLGKIHDVSSAPSPLAAIWKHLRVIDRSAIEASTHLIPHSRSSRVKHKLLFCLKHPRAAARLVGPTLKKGGAAGRFNRMLNDAAIISRCDVDIFHCQFASIADRLVILKSAGLIPKKVKLVSSIRGFDVTHRTAVGNIDWHALNREVSLFLPVCRYFVPILKQRGCKRETRVVPSPVNIDLLQQYARKSEAPKGRPIRLISIGRLVEKKGIADSIEAARILASQSIDFFYTIIGTGKLFDSLQNDILRYHLSDRVEMVGAIPADETIKRLSRCDILITPSKTASTGDSEGIPNVIKEAMAIGVQVITTHHAGIPELVTDGETGYLVPENAPHAIADSVIKLVEHPEQWQKVADKANRHVRQAYTPDISVNKLLEAYHRLSIEEACK